MDHNEIQAKVETANAKATEAQKESALIDATAFITKEFKFRGEPETKSQALAWPRSNAFFDDGTPIRGVPKAVRDATSHLAGYMLADIPMNAETLAVIFAMLAPVLEGERLH